MHEFALEGDCAQWYYRLSKKKKKKNCEKKLRGKKACLLIGAKEQFALLFIWNKHILKITPPILDTSN